MNQFIEAADAIRTIAKRLEGFALAADALERIGSIDQAAKEAQQQRDAALDQAKDAKADLAKARSALASAKEQADSVMDEAGVNAAAIVSKAEADALLIVDRAKAEASGLMNAQKGAFDAAVSEANAEMAKLKGRIKTAKVDAEAIDAEIAHKQAQLEQLNAALAEIKQKLGA